MRSGNPAVAPAPKQLTPLRHRRYHPIKPGLNGRRGGGGDQFLHVVFGGAGNLGECRDIGIEGAVRANDIVGVGQLGVQFLNDFLPDLLEGSSDSAITD